MLRLLRIETSALFRERIGWIVLLVLALACFAAAAGGRAFMAEQLAGREAAAGEATASEKALRESIAEATPETAQFLPLRVSMPVVAPVPPLADFSAGRAAFEPFSTIARSGVREEGLFKRSRLDNPELIARGGLDLGFVAIVVLPLLLIALGYGVFAGDRDSGIARLALVQGGGAGRLLLARSLPRLALALLPLLLAAAFLLLAGPAAAWWLTLTLLLALFWWAVILLVNSFRLSAESAALTLVSLWAMVTLILPPFTNAAAQALNPAPSRFEQIATERWTQISASTAYENDHPPLDEEAAERRRREARSAEIDRQVETALRPIADRFAEQRARQQEVVHALSYLSPASVTANGQAAAAGTDSASWLSFRGATRDYLAAVKTALKAAAAGGQPFTMDAYRAVPRFAWEPPRQPPLVPALYLILAIVIIGGIAVRRFRKAELV